MKIYLDDWREPPPGYLLVKRVDQLKELVRRFGPKIEVLDLDNYLEEYSRFGGNGIDFVNWLEEAVYTGEVELNPDVKIVSHSSDPFMRERIEEVGRRIKAYLRGKR
ncbi:cyclic-phosphate processing receiver domain-containing protein [Thermovibrio sp.]